MSYINHDYIIFNYLDTYIFSYYAKFFNDKIIFFETIGMFISF